MFQVVKIQREWNEQHTDSNMDNDSDKILHYKYFETNKVSYVYHSLIVFHLSSSLFSVSSDTVHYNSQRRYIGMTGCPITNIV